MGAKMQQPLQDICGDRLGQEDNEVRAAVRFALLVAALAVGALTLAALWASTCNGAAAADTAACGGPQRALLALIAPAILLGGGLYSLFHTYRIWRDRGIWWAWQGAGWFLLTLMLLALTMGAPPIAGVS